MKLEKRSAAQTDAFEAPRARSNESALMFFELELGALQSGSASQSNSTAASDYFAGSEAFFIIDTVKLRSSHSGLTASNPGLNVCICCMRT